VVRCLGHGRGMTPAQVGGVLWVGGACPGDPSASRPLGGCRGRRHGVLVRETCQ